MRFQLLLPRFVDDTHATATDFANKLIVTKVNRFVRGEVAWTEQFAKSDDRADEFLQLFPLDEKVAKLIGELRISPDKLVGIRRIAVFAGSQILERCSVQPRVAGAFGRRRVVPCAGHAASSLERCVFQTNRKREVAEKDSATCIHD